MDSRKTAEGPPPYRRHTPDRPKRRRARRPATLLTYSLAAVVMALVLLLVGLPASLGSYLFVDVDGKASAISPGTRLGDVAQAHDLAPREGSLVDVAGDVVRLRGGEPGRLEVGGRGAAADVVPRDGARIRTRRGRDVAERLARRTESVAFQTRSEGSGPVLTMVRAGSPGEREIFAGVRSKRTVASFVLREPVDAAFRRTKGLTSGQKAVALTFDDGPSTFTPDVMKVLAAKGVSATFFVVGKTAAAHKATIDALRAAGHEVENHSWDHADLTKLSPEAISSEITRTASVLGGTRFLRPPYGASNTTVATQAGLAGQRIVMWDVDTRDWQSRNAAAITSIVKAHARPGAIILMHDGGGERSQTVAALSGIIDWLLQQGYALTTVRQLAG